MGCASLRRSDRCERRRSFRHRIAPPVLASSRIRRVGSAGISSARMVTENPSIHLPRPRINGSGLTPSVSCWRLCWEGGATIGSLVRKARNKFARARNWSWRMAFSKRWFLRSSRAEKAFEAYGISLPERTCRRRSRGSDSRRFWLARVHYRRSGHGIPAGVLMGNLKTRRSTSDAPSVSRSRA